MLLLRIFRFLLNFSPESTEMTLSETINLPKVYDSRQVSQYFGMFSAFDLSCDEVFPAGLVYSGRINDMI